MQTIDAKTLGALLCGIHTHAELLLSNSFLKEADNHDIEQVMDNPEQIVYTEADVIELFKALGYPEPEWGAAMSIEEFKNQQDGKGNENKEGTELPY